VDGAFLAAIFRSFLSRPFHGMVPPP
jgi:hypothetical protein